MSEKMLDGMGKSYHELILTIGIIIYEITIVTLIAPIFKHGICVLLGIVIGEVTFGIVYYILLRHLLNKSKNDNITAYAES